MPQIPQHDELEMTVRAHTGWVHACARRRVGDDATAQDVTQAVFILFWRKRGRLGEEVKLTGWLYRAVRYCAADALQTKQIRMRRELEAAMMGHKDRPSGEANWNEVSPELEHAMDRLREHERSAILLRFYRQMSFAEVAQSLGISEAAAQKRVERALEKLRGMLGRKSVGVGAASLGAMLAENATAAAPARVVEGVMAAGGTGGTGTAGVIAKGVMKMMVLVKVKLAAMVLMATAVALIAFGQIDGRGEPVAVAATSRPAEAAQGNFDTLPAIVAELRQRESALMNLTVKGTSQWYKGNPDGAWSPTVSRADFTVYSNGKPGSKARVDYERMTTEWVNGAAPSITRQYSLAYDGQFGRIADHSFAYDGKSFAENGGQILNERPAALDGSGTGQSFSIFFFRSDRSLSEYIGPIYTGKRPVHIQYDAKSGLVSIVRGGPETFSEEHWVLDSRRGFALLKFEQYGWRKDQAGQAQKVLGVRETIQELQEVAPGLWYPIKAEMVTTSWEGGLNKMEYKASFAVANAPDFDEAVFSMKIPPGYTVQNKVTGQVYRVGVTDGELRGMLDETVSPITGIGTTKPAGTGTKNKR